MCGVLAGKPRVVFADQLFLHDLVKRTARGFEYATRPHKLAIR